MLEEHKPAFTLGSPPEPPHCSGISTVLLSLAFLPIHMSPPVGSSRPQCWDGIQSSLNGIAERDFNKHLTAHFSQPVIAGLGQNNCGN